MCHTLAAGVRFGPWEGACSQCGQGRVPPPANCLGIVGGRLRQEVKFKTWWLEGRRGQHANGVEAEAAGGAQGHLAVAATIPAVIHLDGEARFLWRHTSAHTSFSEKKKPDISFFAPTGQPFIIAPHNSPGQPPMSCSGQSGWSQKRGSPRRLRTAAHTLCKCSLMGWLAESWWDVWGLTSQVCKDGPTESRICP